MRPIHTDPITSKTPTSKNPTSEQKDRHGDYHA